VAYDEDLDAEIDENGELPEDHWSNRMDREFKTAATRDAKLVVLKRYMSEKEAEDAIGLMLGEHSGDVRDVSTHGR